jgi:molybdopterin-containing oxidoreductase family membrane subunit
MVVTLMIPARRLLGYQQVVTERHLENMAKVMLATGMMVSYGYVMEHFIAWYSGSEAELFAFLNRWQGHYRGIWYVQLFCNVLTPQIFWFRWARRSEVVLFVASILINVGMWAERFVIIAVSLTRDFVPSSWANYSPTWVDWGLLFGSMATFGALFLLFLRFLPAIPVFEVKELRRELEHHGPGVHHEGPSSSARRRSSRRPGRCARAAIPPCTSTSTRRTRCTAPTRRSGCAARPSRSSPSSRG